MGIECPQLGNVVNRILCRYQRGPDVEHYNSPTSVLDALDDAIAVR